MTLKLDLNFQQKCFEAEGCSKHKFYKERFEQNLC